MSSIVTVTVPTTARLLVSLADVKSELGITDATLDEKLFRWDEATSARFSRACGRTFFAETVSEVFRGHYYRHMYSGSAHGLILTRRPVISITSVTDDGIPLATTDYDADLQAGIIYRLYGECRTSWWSRSVTVVYRAGYDPIPADVSDAVLSIMRHKYATGGRDPLLRMFTIEGVGREDYWVPLTKGDIGDLPLDLQPIADTIAAYRQVEL